MFIFQPIAKSYFDSDTSIFILGGSAGTSDILRFDGLVSPKMLSATLPTGSTPQNAVGALGSAVYAMNGSIQKFDGNTASAVTPLAGSWTSVYGSTLGSNIYGFNVSNLIQKFDGSTVTNEAPTFVLGGSGQNFGVASGAIWGIGAVGSSAIKKYDGATSSTSAYTAQAWGYSSTAVFSSVIYIFGGQTVTPTYTLGVYSFNTTSNCAAVGSAVLSAGTRNSCASTLGSLSFVIGGDGGGLPYTKIETFDGTSMAIFSYSLAVSKRWAGSVTYSLPIPGFN